MKNLFYIIIGLILITNLPSFAITESEKQNVINSDPGVIDSLMLETIQKEQEKKNQQQQTPDFEKLKKKNNSAKIKNSPLFILKEIIFEGNTVIKTEELKKITNEYIGKTLSVNELLDLTKKITKLYQDKGYFTSMAYLPPQKINKGTAKIQLLEGKIGDISIKGNQWYKNKYFKKNIFNPNNLHNNTVLNIQSLRSSLHDINLNEHLNGKVVIEENQDPEFADITLEIEDQFPLNLAISYDNQGRELIGRQRGVLTLSYDNLTGIGDALYAGTALANGTFGLNSGYNMPIGEKGTKLNFNYSYSNIKIGGDNIDLKSADIHGYSNNYAIGITRPLIKKDNLKLTGNIGFDFRDAITYQKNQPLIISKYNLRVLRTGLNAIKDDFRGRWIANSTISTGIPLFGGTERNFATGEYGNDIGTNKFVKMETGVTRLQILPKKSLGIFKVSGQWATRRLLAPEQFQIGGINTVRGYDEGFLIGDWGVCTSIEIRTPVPFLKSILPQRLEFVDEKIKWANFIDFGYVDNMHNDGERYTNLLVGIGSGVNIQLSKYLKTNIYLGIPLGHQKHESDNISYDGQDARIHFNLTSDIY